MNIHGQDVIDSRDVIARIEELEGEDDREQSKCGQYWTCELCRDPEADDSPVWACDGCNEPKPGRDCCCGTCGSGSLRRVSPFDCEECEELTVLHKLQEEAQSSPDWAHGEALIRDSYFEQYAQELAEDCGMVARGAQWPNYCIDWERATNDLKHDYFSVDFDGEEYWIRA